ncbi:MAG: hypothetical protein IKP86_05575 [Anaerolineaceae bacterium]|nr:hypothetical protein [Anaerolineaceae bacterium]
MKFNYGKFIFLIISSLVLLIAGTCFAADEPLEDGIYSALFNTDSSMFKVCEANEGRGILTVKDGKMIIHVSLSSKNIVNLFPGMAADAKLEGAVLLEPTTDEVVYSDGYKDTVYGFDIPVEALGEEFDLAIIGKKGKWYDHKVSVSDLIRIEDEKTSVEDGTWLCDVTLSGGSGKATVETPALLTVTDGAVTAKVTWSSPNYEYMLVNDVKYEPVQTDGNSAFEIPVVLDTEMAVSASTVAMSRPHLIDYTLCFDSSTLQPAGE